MQDDSVQRGPDSVPTVPKDNDGAVPNWGLPPTRSTGLAGNPVSMATPTASRGAPPPPTAAQPPPRPRPGPTSPQTPPRQKGQTPSDQEEQGDAARLGPKTADRRLPPLSPVVAIAAIAVAFLINLAVQSRLYSLATLCATVLTVGLLLGRSQRRRLSVLAPAALALAAGAIVMLRSSPWVTLPSFAVLIVALVITSQDRLLARSGFAMTFATYLVDVVDSIRWLLRPLGVTIQGTLGGQGGSSSANGRVLRGVALAVAAVVPLTWLLASADPVFGQVLASGAGKEIWVHGIITALVLPAITGLALSARQLGRSDDAPTPRPKQGSMVEGLIVLASVATLLGAWGLTQIVVAAGGAERLLATVDLTAAQNVRQGFFQLVAATALLVGILIGVDRYVERSSATDRLRFLALTAVIGLETIGVVFATYSRLSLYVHGFGHTMLRTAVAWFLAWLVVVMVVLIVMMNRRAQPNGRSNSQPNPEPRPRTLGGPIFLLAGAWVVAFGLSNPEAFVAGSNLERGLQPSVASVQLDTGYLTTGLGPDAVPTIIELLPSLEGETQRRLSEELCARHDLFEDPGILGWNRSLDLANGAVRSLDCRGL